MSKALSLSLLLLFIAATSHAQAPCPVMLVSGSLGQDSITLSFRNKGKLPIEQLRLSCKSSTGRSANAACATETGVFYPGMQYSMHLAYPNPRRRQVIVSVTEVVMSGGEHWDIQSADRCRSLRISKKG
ncbi:MAG TPA: hypothetical protein VIM60_04595 [Edaphobacter sp.]